MTTKVTTKEVLMLAQMYVARGYTLRGWIAGGCDACCHGVEVRGTSEWHQVERTSAVSAITLACMDIFGRWYEVPQYEEAMKALHYVAGRENFDELCAMSEHIDQDQALDWFSRAIG